MPADPYVVARFLIHRYDKGLSVSSVAQSLLGIRHYHRNEEAGSPTDHRVTRTMSGLRRRAQREGKATPKQAKGLKPGTCSASARRPALRRPWGADMESAETARKRGLLEIAMISSMRDALLRWGEAAPL